MAMAKDPVVVVVVGAGVVGLCCAHTLLCRGCRVHIVAEEFPPRTTSDGAGALLRPAFVGVPEQVGRAWFRATFRAVRARMERLGPRKAGAARISGFEVYESPEPTPYWSDVVEGFEAMSEHDLAALRSRCGACWTTGHRYASLMLNTPEYLCSILAEIKLMGGTTEQRRVNSLEGEGSAAVVVNCTALGSRRLASDPLVRPARGQTVKVGPLPAVTSFAVSHQAGALTYVLPRPFGGPIVLGGTHEDGDWETSNRPEQVRDILSRARRLEPALGEAVPAGAWAGLRAERPSVRLEAEVRGSTPVVHCYGFGGCGLSMSWGAADDVAALVLSLVELPSPSKSHRQASL